MSSEIFISYAREDKEIVRHIYDKLKAAGLDPWLDVENILPGANWQRSINQAIRESNIFIAILSRNSVKKRGIIQKEILKALDKMDELLPDDIFIIPLRLDDCDIPERLAHLQALDWDYEDGLKKLLDTIREILVKREEQRESKINKRYSASEIESSNNDEEALYCQEANVIGETKPQAALKEKNAKKSELNDAELLERVRKLCGEIGYRFIKTLYNQVDKPVAKEKFTSWLERFYKVLVFREEKITVPECFIVSLEQHIRLIGVNDMIDIFDPNFDDLPPTDSYAAFLLRKAALEIEGSITLLASYKDGVPRTEIGSDFKHNSLGALGNIKDVIRTVLNLFDRYSPPDTLFPDELVFEELSAVTEGFSIVISDLDAHIAMRGRISREYEDKIRRCYFDLNFYASRYADWLKKLAKRADGAINYL